MPSLRFPTRRTTLIALVLAGVATAGMIGSGAMRNRAVEATAAAAPKSTVLEFVPEDLYRVREDTLARTLPLTGTLTPLTTATVKAKVAGELMEVTAREGQTVKQGQVLARIDLTEVQAKVAARQADVEAAKAQLQWADKNRATQKALLDKSFISQNAFDNIQSNFDVAVAKLRAADADLVSAKKILLDAVLVAPFSGVVSERHVQPGERVPLDAKVISVVDLSRLELEASVPASTLAQVKIGQPVAFRVDGFGERTFQGRIERINPSTASGSRSISIYAIIENADGQLRGGLFAQGELILERVENVLVVPGSAVREEIGQTFVYAIENGLLRKKPVKVGRSDASGKLQVFAGLAAGDVIVKSNLGQLNDASPAQIRERVAAPPAGARGK